MPATRPPLPRIGFVSLGCPKATVDAERILTQLRAWGYRIAPDYASADLVVVNTCGFIDAAVEESLAAIAEALSENGRVVVTGCLGTRAEFVREQYPQVLGIFGTQATAAALEAIRAWLPPPRQPFDALLPGPMSGPMSEPGIKLTPPHYAYIKIAEGCDHRCQFCVIPSLRGGLVSRPVGEILDEAERLVEAGVRELLIVAQDTGAYGQDRQHRHEFWRGRPLRADIETLAGELGRLPAWVRLHYLYPYPRLDRLVALMAEGRILPYLDMPLQHASPAVLRAMQRPAASERVLERLAGWRRQCPELRVRSTFIVGFPGERESDFQHLLEFLREARLDRVGCFCYSPVAGAAANALPAPVPEPVKQERRERLMAVQAEISRARLAERVGQRHLVLIDQVEEQRCLGRTVGDAPEIDGLAILPGAWDLTPGDFIEARAIASTEHDLIVEPIASEDE